ncbi:hypothetical protein [Novosphingobium marinum]|nr:hypothetical protein [Novosphingobium marinum]
MIKGSAIFRGTCILSAIALLTGCGSQQPLMMYFSGDPEMGSFSSYTGRLAERDGCVVIVLGEEMLRESKIAVQDDQVAIPLFQPGYRVEEQEQGYSIIADDGRRIPFGSIVTGEGGPYPTEPLDPRSAPLRAEAPDTSSCPGTPYQINSMHIEDLTRL